MATREFGECGLDKLYLHFTDHEIRAEPEPHLIELIGVLRLLGASRRHLARHLRREGIESAAAATDAATDAAQPTAPPAALPAAVRDHDVAVCRRCCLDSALDGAPKRAQLRGGVGVRLAQQREVGQEFIALEVSSHLKETPTTDALVFLGRDRWRLGCSWGAGAHVM